MFKKTNEYINDIKSTVDYIYKQTIEKINTQKEDINKLYSSFIALLDNYNQNNDLQNFKIKKYIIQNQINDILNTNIEDFKKKLKDYIINNEPLSTILNKSDYYSNFDIYNNSSIIKYDTEEFNFKWENPSDNVYELSDDKYTATKINNESLLNCYIIGNKSLLKGKINKWKIKLKHINYEDDFDIYIGIANKEENLNTISSYQYCWTYICSKNIFRFLKKLKENSNTDFKPLKQGDYLGVAVDLRDKKGILSFSFNDDKFIEENTDIPTDIPLVPIAIINKPRQSIEIIPFY